MNLHDKPMAAHGLTSYRYKGDYGWIMIGARSDSEALSEANRSLYRKNAVIDNLEIWGGSEYQSTMGQSK